MEDSGRFDSHRAVRVGLLGAKTEVPVIRTGRRHFRDPLRSTAWHAQLKNELTSELYQNAFLGPLQQKVRLIS